MCGRLSRQCLHHCLAPVPGLFQHPPQYLPPTVLPSIQRLPRSLKWQKISRSQFVEDEVRGLPACKSAGCSTTLLPAVGRRGLLCRKLRRRGSSKHARARGRRRQTPCWPVFDPCHPHSLALQTVLRHIPYVGDGQGEFINDLYENYDSSLVRTCKRRIKGAAAAGGQRTSQVAHAGRSGTPAIGWLVCCQCKSAPAPPAHSAPASECTGNARKG